MRYSGLGADYVAGLKAFGAFEQIELHGLTLVERAIAVLLNGGEMYENILTRGALDETISLRPVEPLHSSLLSHGKTPFAWSLRISSPGVPDVAPANRGTPSRKSGGTWLRFFASKKFTPKQKTPRFIAERTECGENLWRLDQRRCFLPTYSKRQPAFTNSPSGFAEVTSTE